MTAPEYEVRPPVVRALRWTPGEIETVGRVLTWLEFNGASPEIVGGMGSAAILAIRSIESAPNHRTVVHPGEWIIRRASGFVVSTNDEFARTYREAQQ